MTANIGLALNERMSQQPDRALKIALLSEFAYPFHNGGAERRYYEIASRLVARGHEVHWYAMPHWPGGGSFDFQGIHLHAAGKPFDVYAESGRRSISAGLRLGFALTRALFQAPTRFDVVDCSLYPFFHVLGATLVRPRTPTVVSWYEFWGQHWYAYLGWRGFAGKQVELLVSRTADRIISVSELAAAGLASAGVPGRRVEVVHLGVDTARIDSFAPAPDSSDVVSFGRLKDHKNVDLLLRALASVRETKPAVRCAIVGDGPERGRLERIVQDLRLEQNVLFYGEVDESRLIGLVKASRLFVNASTKEGGGSLTLLEANACGIPAIAVRHDLGIDASLIEQGRNGWWIRRPDVEDLAHAISNGLDAIDRTGAAVWSERCRAFARAYDWDVATSRCEQIYFDVAA